MNCKPGDLARVIRARSTPEMLNRLVYVIRKAGPEEFFDYFHEPKRFTWIVQSAVRGQLLPRSSAFGPLPPALERPLADECLRPIRDPGKDATDEVIQRLGKPVSDGVTA